MIPPIRWRKPEPSHIMMESINQWLEMITPIRGRKQQYFLKALSWAAKIRNDNPDKGTETVRPLKCQPFCIPIRNDNPDKGTETICTWSFFLCVIQKLEMITPIRGRKHKSPHLLSKVFNALEMITPIRGRKRIYMSLTRGLTLIRNDSPDKGTETSSVGSLSFSTSSIRNDTPARGCPLNSHIPTSYQSHKT